MQDACAVACPAATSAGAPLALSHSDRRRAAGDRDGGRARCRPAPARARPRLASGGESGLPDGHGQGHHGPRIPSGDSSPERPDPRGPVLTCILPTTVQNGYFAFWRRVLTREIVASVWASGTRRIVPGPGLPSARPAGRPGPALPGVRPGQGSRTTRDVGPWRVLLRRDDMTMTEDPERRRVLSSRPARITGPRTWERVQLRHRRCTGRRVPGTARSRHRGFRGRFCGTG